jgi:hypothetical protein
VQGNRVLIPFFRVFPLADKNEKIGFYELKTYYLLPITYYLSEPYTFSANPKYLCLIKKWDAPIAINKIKLVRR